MATSNYTVRLDELTAVREELTLARAALTKERHEHARTHGQASVVAEQLNQALRIATENKAALDSVRGTLGDLRDWVDELTTCRSVGEMRARIAVLTGEHDEAEGGELSVKQEIGRTEGRTL